jgi:hypothetical protein
VIVNLAVDHVSAVPLVRTADIRASVYDRPFEYQIAARKIGLSEAQWIEAVDDSDTARLVVLPRRVAAMAGRCNTSPRCANGTVFGGVYVVKNALLPAGVFGYSLVLHDGTTVLWPLICGNPSMIPPAHKVVVAPFRNTPPYGYHPPTPVVFVPTPAVPVASYVPPVVAAVPIVPAAAGIPLAPFAALLFPIVAAFHGGGGGGGSTMPAMPVIPPCSGGSNEYGGCQR